MRARCAERRNACEKGVRRLLSAASRLRVSWRRAEEAPQDVNGTWTAELTSHEHRVSFSRSLALARQLPGSCQQHAHCYMGRWKAPLQRARRGLPIIQRDVHFGYGSARRAACSESWLNSRKSLRVCFHRSSRQLAIMKRPKRAREAVFVIVYPKGGITGSPSPSLCAHRGGHWRLGRRVAAAAIASSRGKKPGKKLGGKWTWIPGSLAPPSAYPLIRYR